MLVAVMFGVVAGIVGFSPLVLAWRLARSRNSNVRQNSIMLGVFLVVSSLLVLMVLLVVASIVIPGQFLGFGIGLVTAFLVASLIFSFIWMRR